MFKKMSLKAKMIGMFTLLIVLTCAILTGVFYFNSHRMAANLSSHTLEMKINGDIRAAELYKDKYYGKINMTGGQLVKQDGQPIEGCYAMVDAIAEDLGVVATIFVREGNDFRRISTNIRQADGSRAVGTFLGTGSTAYNPVMQRSLYIGQATILGSPYLTAYNPIVNQDNEVIGIMFLGIPQSEVNAIASANVSTLLRNTGIAFVIVLAVAICSTVLFAVALSRRITGIIESLTEGAQQVASASGQVSSASQSLAEGATEQAAGLEETSSSLEEMSSMTKQNADNAQQASVLAGEARKAAQGGAESMQRMSRAIDDIQKSSDETAKIIKVIDEIAFQTNLLALNAAVEAARAGEAGKGFAVVAEEVRNLAMRSAEAAKNTANMIEESVKNAKNGVAISGEVSKALGEIVDGIAKTTDLVGEIAAASAEQAQGIDQVNTAVAQMDKVTQQNAANAEESASASEELSAQAEAMQGIVEELVALVQGASGGRLQGRGQSPRRAAGSGSHKALGLGDQTFHHIAEGPKKASRSAGGKAASTTTAGKSLPLDDDFSNFSV
jgi:methyl-accepting chemotaxis protein